MIRALVVARSPVVRGGFEEMLAGESPGEVVAAGEPADVYFVADESLLDGLLEGFAASDGEVVEEVEGPALVLLSDDEEAVEKMVSAPLGGWAVVPTYSEPEEIIAALAAASRGLVVLPKPLAQTLLRAGVPPKVPAESSRLTPREEEVLDLLGRGLPNKQIARSLGISEHTVKFHVSSLFAKLEAANRAEAVARAARLGLLTL